MIPDINLLPNIDKKAEGGKLIYILMGAVTALALIAFAVIFIFSMMEAKSLEEKQQALVDEETKLQQELDMLQNMNAGSLEESLAFVERVSYPVSPLIDEAQKLLTDNTYLRQYSFSSDAITISVDFEMLSDVAHYVEALNGSDYFNDVQVTSVSNFDLNPITDEQEVSQKRLDTQKFEEKPRYSVTINLLIDSMYLATGGGQ